MAMIPPDDLDRIERYCAAATEGPWWWAEDRFRDKYGKEGKGGIWRSRPGKSMNDSWLYCLLGAKQGCVSDLLDANLDEFDYRHVMMLRWRELKRTSVVNATPSPIDRNFIASARTDLPRLVAAYREALAEIEALKARVADGGEP